MEALEQSRDRINEIDRQMAELFEARMDAVASVISFKIAQGLPILDEKRESLVLEKNSKLINNPAYLPYYRAFLQGVIEVSKKYQRAALNAQVVGYQGTEGAFGHIAMTRLFEGVEGRAYATFEDVFAAVSAGDIARGVIPFENSFTGEVGEVLDLLLKYDCHINAVYDLRVHQNLLTQPGARLEDIKQVYSHHQAISQCQEFLHEHAFEAIPYLNTALAAKYVSESGDPSKAAIASAETAQLYGLKVLARGINTSVDNTTRFIVIGKALPSQGNRFNLIFTISRDHEPGQLATIMSLIGSMGFSLESIKSRPLRNVPWQYYFYAEIVGSLADEKSVALLQSLAKQCGTLKVLGAYTLDNTTRGEE